MPSIRADIRIRHHLALARISRIEGVLLLLFSLLYVCCLAPWHSHLGHVTTRSIAILLRILMRARLKQAIRMSYCACYSKQPSLISITTMTQKAVAPVIQMHWSYVITLLMYHGCHRSKAWFDCIVAGAITPEQDDKYQVFYDPCRARPGGISCATLPSELHALCTSQVNTSHLAFVFEGKVAGLRCIAMYDSGEAISYTSKDFVSSHKVATHEYASSMHLGNSGCGQHDISYHTQVADPRPQLSLSVCGN